MTSEQKTIGILIFEDVEVLDFCGPFEVFYVTRLDDNRRRETDSPFRPLLIAESMEPVKTTGGMNVLPHHTLVDCPRLDLLVVPGGWGTRREMKNDSLLDWIRTKALEIEATASVCTGSLVLAASGLLKGRSATTHWRSLELMRDRFPDTKVEFEKRFTFDGNIFTSAGISAGIDLSLQIVARYYGEVIARQTARHMEYPYPETDAR